MGLSQQKRAALSEIMKGNDFGRVDICFNHEAIARDMWARRRDSADIARALGLSEADVVNGGLHRSQVLA
jgi:hypothetical protein